MARPIDIAEAEVTINGQTAFCAGPRESGSYPAAVMLPDVFGLRELAREQARRLARHGVVALYLHPLRGTDAFDPVTDPEAREKCSPFVQAVTVDQCMEDLREGVRCLGARDDVDPDGVLLWGYCWGGSMVFRGASRVADIAGVVVWHGMLRGEELETVPGMKGSILGLFGGIDHLIPVSDVEALGSRPATLRGSTTPSTFTTTRRTRSATTRDPKDTEEQRARQPGARSSGISTN